MGYHIKTKRDLRLARMKSKAVEKDCLQLRLDLEASKAAYSALRKQLDKTVTNNEISQKYGANQRERELIIEMNIAKQNSLNLQELLKDKTLKLASVTRKNS